MPMTFLLIFLVTLPACIFAVRDSTELVDTWLGKSDVWCASTDHSIACDEDSVIRVRSAFFNRQKRATCEPLQSGREPGCGANATDAVFKLCENKMTCSLRAGDHAACADRPYTLIRVRWECAANSDMPDDGEIISKVGLEEKVKHDILEPQVTRTFQFYLIPCYRHTRMHLLSSLNFFGRLTGCGDYEGCFKLSFPDGKVYDDPNVPPTEEEIEKAKLIQGTDSAWVTWQSIGLVRNDYNTWGICFPKNQGVQYALALWKSVTHERYQRNV